MPTTEPASHRDLARIVLAILGIGVLIVGSLRVMLPFLGALLWAAAIVISTWPLMIRVQGWLGGRRGWAVAVMTVVLLLILFVPLLLAVSTIFAQYDRVAEMAKGLPTMHLPPPPSWVAGVPLVGPRLVERWLELAALDPHELSERLAPHLRTALAWFAQQAGSFGSMVGQFLLTIAISAILYAKGEGAEAWLRRFFRRLSGERGDAIVTLAGKATRAVALGIVVTALAQSVIAAAGLVGVGVPFAGFLTAIVFVLCIAQLGPLLAMVPCVIWLYATGAPGRGTVLLVITIVAQAIDNVIRPVLIRRGADLSLLLILPGVIGGLLWLGIIGLFVGPVILAVTSSLLESWMSSGLGETAPEAALPTPATSSGTRSPPPPGVAGGEGGVRGPETRRV
jgi:predicted PurR-regulated permease PerM